MKKRCLAYFVVTALQAAATNVYSDFIYDVDFEDPPHVLGSLPVTGSGPDRPSDASLGAWSISDNIADFGTQVAFLSGTTGSEFMSFNPGQTFSTGIYLASWEWALVTPDGSVNELQTSVQLHGTEGPGPEVVFSYLFDGSILVTDPLGGGGSIGNHTVGQSATYGLLFDLDADTYDVSVNGSPVLSNQALDAGTEIVALGFSRPFGSPSFAIDNFQWQVIPEPSTIALMLLALGGLALGRIRR